MINISGAAEGRIAPAAASIIRKTGGQSLIVVPTLNRAKRLAEDLSFFGALEFEGSSNEEGMPPIYILPQEEDSLVQYEAKSNNSLLERIKVLKEAVSGKPCIIIAPVTGAIKKLPPKALFAENVINLRVGDDLDLDELRDKLFLMGYERVSMLENKGEYSIRGGIIDIFTPDCEMPFRIELFDTEVDSIRCFDLESQRSEDAADQIVICQCSQILREKETFAKASEKIAKAYDRSIKKIEKKNGKTEQSYNLKKRKDQILEYIDGMINLQYMEKFINYFYDETMYIWDYMESPTILIDDPARILETLEVFEKERSEDIEILLADGKGIGEDFASISGSVDYFKLYQLPDELNKDGYLFTPFTGTIKNAPFLTELRQISCRQTPSYNGRLDVLKADLDSYVAKGFAVTLVCSSSERMKNLLEFIDREGFNGRKLPAGKTPGHIIVRKGEITAGVELPEEKRCFIWEGDIFGGSRKSARRRRRDKSKGQQIKNFADVQVGDYVVHESHGIGRFEGIEQLVVQGVQQDYLKVKYAGTDSLYIPVDQLKVLQKYIGGDGVTPKLNKLAGSEWKKTKARAKAAVMDIAEDLIRVSAARMESIGYAFEPDTVWQREFEDSFPYEETDDQLKCIDEIKADMEKSYPMDRLLCGDVGFGKTEVAARALFKCVADGKQAAVLVPTTLLANQHYYTLKDRFEKFPFKVEMLSRFRSPAQQKAILKGIKEGSIDLIIGTHRLLSQDIEFKDLGLLVVDEEQRFGVNHKERIKQIRENVDVLTLSATPIPRTLHMSLSGIKDMSTIEEPPEERIPVQTYVMEQDDFVIREAIEKEMARGGQVYVLYNKVNSIKTVAAEIKRLVPEAEVAIGHGRMNENTLENVILDFANHEYDVLVSTTIIESGMDIPNVNTMIVMDADHFGLAQLYQLRGRVGRSGRMAYAYLMYKKDKTLSEIAEKRLRAIREFTEFGSGFRIAMKDLELRGAGNLLGTEQSGHMLDVGYELYCKMLEEAVEGLKGENVMPQAEETVFSIPIPAIIPEWYIRDEMLRLQMYKKISMVGSDDDELDIIDELLDRFGDVPKDTMNLIKISKIRTMAGSIGVRDISLNGSKMIFKLYENARFKDGVIPKLAVKYGEKIRFNGGRDPHIRLTVGKAVLQEAEVFLKEATGEGLQN